MAGTSEAGTSRGTVNTPDGSAYDVFLNFRGPDTRYNITDFLYVFMREKGIRVFRDTEEICNGEEIGDELRQAVPDSRIYVVVFSKGYASSAWCLRELAMMVDCRRNPASRKVILPIFYDVSPSDVKLQTDLKKVGGIRGLEYKRDVGMGEFVCAVVADILNKLNIKGRSLTDHLVGMDDRVENVIDMLNLSSHVERNVVMVHGMGGIGKTTLGIAIFNGLMRPSDAAYEVEGIGDDHALQLFSWHAFHGEGPPNDFVDLSKGVIHMSGNLPLDLKAIGGHLFRKEKNKWEHTLEKLERVPHKDVLNTLRISYDDLDESEKQIFLDIACFDHNAMPRKYASYMWEACGFFPESGLDVLQNRSLIKVLNVDDDFEDKYCMHDLIREMGREIVKSEKPGKCSRLWDPELALHVISRKQGTDRVLAIDLEGGHKLLTGYEFEGMSNLRFLNLRDGAELSGEFRNFRTNLLWLRWSVGWKRGPNPSFFHMDSLVILEISGKGITDDSMKEMRMGNLRVLVISDTGITRLADLSRFPKLEIIDLRFCRQLKEIHSSIGILGDLKRLIIACCGELIRLPEELGSAKALQELSLIRCGGISELPESIGGLGDLRILRGIGTKIRKLPSSIGDLKSLEVLEINRFPISVRIPKSEVPNLARCNLSGLTSLRSLALIGLEEDVEGIEKLYGLQKLKLEYVGSILSTNLDSMSKLEDLYLHSWNISSASQLPSSLRKLTLVGCWQSMQSGTSLDGLDNMENMSYPIRLSDLGSLRRLCSLRLEECERIDFSGVERMEHLEELSVICCGDFMGEIADMSNLTRLKTVEFCSCNSLIRVPCMAEDCHLMIYECRELASFLGPYRQYHNKRKRRRIQS